MRTLTVGIAGTAKNTGKTTTMSCLMDEIRKNTKLTMGLTSIGYDGENIDNITGLPKPRIDVLPGDITAIAESCIKTGSAVLEELKRTEIATPLGKVVICKVIQPGKMILAGPNNSRDLKNVLEILRKLTEIVIVDGALNRIAPMVEADCLIIATGAARNTEISQLAYESACMVDILSIPVIPETGNVYRVDSILSRDELELLIKESANSDTISINGVFGAQLLEELTDMYTDLPGGKSLIFADPLKLLIAGDATRIKKALYDLSGACTGVGVAEANKLLAITVNPYYPKYRYESEDYQAAYIDGDELLATVSERVSVSCYDVIKQGGQGIYNALMQYRKEIS